MTTTKARAAGKWHDILRQLGIDDDLLSGKHRPCPMCGGKDRFRFLDTDGAGTYICNQCGGGDAFDLLMGVTKESFKECARRVDLICKTATVRKSKPAMPEYKRREFLRWLYRQSKVATQDDLVGLYLQARGFDWIPNDILFCPSCPSPDKVNLPAMVAIVSDIDGKPYTMHRTFLGKGKKADMENPRAMMPGRIPDGACIRLGPLKKHIGIAEGIETAMAAQKRFGVVTWAASNAPMLQKWKAPEGVERVTIFGDCDAKYGGQASAYTLAHKLAVSGLAVRVEIPDKFGTDWADL